MSITLWVFFTERKNFRDEICRRFPRPFPFFKNNAQNLNPENLALRGQKKRITVSEKAQLASCVLNFTEPVD
jgi:hypothetical protein